jgi:hypothetical protein
MFGSRSLQQLDILSRILVGLVAASSIGIVYQFKRAIDNKDSAKIPSLGMARVSQHSRQPATTDDAASASEQVHGDSPADAAQIHPSEPTDIVRPLERRDELAS